MAPPSPVRHAKPQKANASTVQQQTTPASPQDALPARYDEVQVEEIEVLQAIFMDDYEEVKVKSAWSKTNDRAFKLNLKASSDPTASAILSVVLTATYPRSLPILAVSGLEALHERTQNRIRRLLIEKPKELVGEVMIHAIASDISDALEDAAQARANGVLPSLEEERATTKAADEARAQLEMEAEQKRQAEAKAEEERSLQAMVQQELARRETRQTKQNHSVNVDISAGTVQFDEVVEVSSADDVVSFDCVQMLDEISAGPGVSDYMAKPIGGKSHTLLLRQISLQSKSADTGFRAQLVALEQEIAQVKKLQHSNLVRLYTFRLDKVVDEHRKASIDHWTLSILSDLSNRGTVEELLEDGQVVGLERAKQWSLDLLDALEYVHHHGVVHKNIQSSNISITRSKLGIITPRLTNIAYGSRLADLNSDLEKAHSQFESWVAPECRAAQPQRLYSRKSDIWDFGTVLLQMFMGANVLSRFAAPQSLLSEADLSDAFHNLAGKFFAKDPKHRPTAFELLPSEFFRSAAGVYDDASTKLQPLLPRPMSSSNVRDIPSRRSRHSSSGAAEALSFSRYTNDFTELHRLGRGGFGEVVKVRNKIDGGLYAVKKIKSESRAQLEQVLSEVMLLHRLNHPYVVRYYSAWVEDEVSSTKFATPSTMSTSIESGTSTSERSPMDFGLSSRGLDFVSSSGFKNIQFEDDSDDSQSDADEDDGIVFGTSSSDAVGQPAIEFEDSDEEAIEEAEPMNVVRAATKPRASSTRAIRSTLYIQMELCEKKTLRDLIMRGLPANADESWQMLRQILEGLAHIHGNGIIHRDLKPDNIFIDAVGNPRIGDFGLATTSRTAGPSRLLSSQHTGGDMTRSIGTALYVAPEIQSQSNSSYNDKVDMYSLGIIFFEMCYSLPTAMERVKTLRQIRQKGFELPALLFSGDKAVQGTIISSLLSHSPSERPSSVDLLRSGKIPQVIEDETIRTALLGLGDSGSPYYQKILSALFSQSTDQRVKNYAWDVNDDRGHAATSEEVQVGRIAKSMAESVFRRHGAIETTRAGVFPRSPLYANSSVVQLLDTSGSLLQLPFDLTLPHVRELAKRPYSFSKSYTFGEVFRDLGMGGPPRSHSELDFDIVSGGENKHLHEAEVIKVVDELIEETPALAVANMCYHLNHSDVVNAILDLCHIEPADRAGVKESLSKLNYHQWTWAKVRSELRSPLVGISSTALDALSAFDFRDTYDKAAKRLCFLLEKSTHLEKVKAALDNLQQVCRTVRDLGVHRTCFICPLSCHNEKFYEGGMLFQAIYDKRNRSVFAAGGRYDSLIRMHSTISSGSPPVSAVGVNIGWDGLISAMLKHANAVKAREGKRVSDTLGVSAWAAKRCDVLVATTDQLATQSACSKILATLWAADISAELASDADEIDGILTKQRSSVNHSFIIIVKPDSINSVRIRNLLADTEAETALPDIPSHIRSELRSHAHAHNDTAYFSSYSSSRRSRPSTAGISSTTPTTASSSSGVPSLSRQDTDPSTSDGHGVGGVGSGGNVTVLLAQHRSKKSNKYAIVSAARATWAAHLDALSRRAPILAVETRDEALCMIRDETRLADPESWRRVVQRQVGGDRAYLGQVHGLLEEARGRWKAVLAEAEGGVGARQGAAASVAGREVGLFNFRTGLVVYYDLGL